MTPVNLPHGFPYRIEVGESADKTANITVTSTKIKVCDDDTLNVLDLPHATCAPASPSLYKLLYRRAQQCSNMLSCLLSVRRTHEAMGEEESDDAFRRERLWKAQMRHDRARPLAAARR